MNKKRARRILTVLALVGLVTLANSYSAQAATTVRGQQLAHNDTDSNGIPDAGAMVTGGYKEVSGGCDYVVQYRGDYGNTPYLDSGVIQNEIKCPEGTYNYTIVSADDPRYTGNPEWAIWGSWEIVKYTERGQGNLVRRAPVAV